MKVGKQTLLASLGAIVISLLSGSCAALVAQTAGGAQTASDTKPLMAEQVKVPSNGPRLGRTVVPNMKSVI
jgi:hypothetical protein